MNPLTRPSLSLTLALSSLLPVVVVAPVTVESAQAQPTATILYVNPNSGDDQTGNGDPDRPYQTLTQAIAIAPSNAVIQLASGTYSEETGETFPIIVRKPIEIRGELRNQGYNVKIEGGGQFNSPTGGGQHVGIVLLENATLTGVNVTNKLDRGVGVWIENASPTLLQNTFERNDNTGVAVNGTGRPTILNNYFYSNSGNGLVIYGRTQPTVKDNTFERTGYGISVMENASPQIIGNEIKSNRIGVIVQGQAQAILRENTITQSTEDGFVAISNSRPDLGTAEDPGRNIFRSNGGKDIKNLTKDYTIPASGNRLASGTEGEVDLNRAIAARIPQDQSPSPARSVPLSNADPATKEQIWTAPNSANSLPPRANTPLPPLRSLPLVEPEPDSRPLSPPSPEPASGGNSGRNRLEEILVLEPNVSPNRPPTRRNPNSLPVPSGNIPTGSPVRPGASPEERAAAVGGEYRVVVEIIQASDKTKVKQIVPDAFTSRYQGRAVMQVGIFRSQANAEEVRQRLRQEGLQVRVIPL